MKIKLWSFLFRSLGVTIAGMVFLTACGMIRTQEDEDNEKIGVTVIGVHHLGPEFSIGDFYVNGSFGGDVGRNGGGAGLVCCAELPRKWRPGLVMKVKWSVYDWSKSIRSEVNAENYDSVSLEKFVAVVPVEKYDEVGDLYPHFFPNGKVRLISSNYPISSPKHPLQWDDPSAVKLATLGIKGILNLNR